VPLDHALVVEPQQRDHVGDVLLSLDHPGAEPGVPGNTRWSPTRPCSKSSVQICFGKENQQHGARLGERAGMSLQAV
jgi:hypothetical protein